MCAISTQFSLRLASFQQLTGMNLILLSFIECSTEFFCSITQFYLVFFVGLAYFDDFPPVPSCQFSSFTQFYWVLPSFTGFYLVLLGFIQFYWVLPSFTGFYTVLFGFTQFYWVSPSFTGFYLVLLDYTQFYWVLPSFTEFYWVLPSFTGFYWVLLGFTEFYWV